MRRADERAVIVSRTEAILVEKFVKTVAVSESES
jgi:hypothetical protein